MVRLGKHKESRGFALVVSLSLMVLLVVVAVGLLSLSSISLRSSASTQAMSEARQNAKLAMMMAISQLQSLSGQDTRVTACSNMIDPTAVTATGVWRSWEGTDHDSTGKATIPKYDMKLKAGDPAKQAAASNEGRFLGWLTSTTAVVAPDVKRISDVSSKSGKDMIPMVSAGSVIEPKSEVYMTPTMLDGSKGAIAWWTSGDNAKAMINTDRAPKPTGITSWQERVRSNGRADAKTFGMEAVDDESTPALPSTGSLDLVASKNTDLRKFHDLTAFSKGLLTNTATGGWRKDLSLMSENYSSLPAANLPFFTVSPGKDILYSKSQPNGTSGKPLLYPWANYAEAPPGQWWVGKFPPVCSWSKLVDFTQQYRNLPANGSEVKTSMQAPLAYGSPDNRTQFHDRVRRVPEIARIQWVYSIASRKVSGSNPATYNPGILVTPVLTLWNPYNVEITADKFVVDVRYKPTPLAFEMQVGSKAPWIYYSEYLSGESMWYKQYPLTINQRFTLAPGATRIFSLKKKEPVTDLNNVGNIIFDLEPGYTPGGGLLFTKIANDGTTEIQAAASENFKILRMFSAYRQTDNGRHSMYSDISVNGTNIGFNRSAYNSAPDEPDKTFGGTSLFKQYYPSTLTPVSRSISSIDVTAAAPGSIRSLPVGTVLFGYRSCSPFFRDDGSYRFMRSKGMLQTTLFPGYLTYGGHPINGIFDYALKEMNNWNSDVAPEYDAAGNNSSYIVSGIRSRDGLTRCVMVELPTRPLQSLAELQHLDARGHNPEPPFQFNIIGNGSALPMLAPSQVSKDSQANDDSCLLNHLLFDDWFCSSIAVDVKDFGSSVERAAEQVYKDHLTLTTPLPNRFYEPSTGAAAPDINTAVADAAVSGPKAGAKDSKTGKYPFETIASKLQVNGMFNINSVSLEAWKAVLRQGRDMQVPYLAVDGSTKLGAKSSFSYPRTSIAGDQGSDSGSKESNPLFPDAAEFAGHRVLTDVQIDALAENIVAEIKKRGPFLSLAEFVNRQLSTDKELALASTIQKSLDNLAKLGKADTTGKNPFAKIQATAPEIVKEPDNSPPRYFGYQFPEAALGSSAFGVPGWVRQADILRPLAPVMSARDDTFTIRAYGDSRDKTGKILAKAWCEVTVTRQADFVDPSDSAAVAPFSTAMKSAINRRFGRRYQVVSFRWLDPQEI